MMTDIKKTRLYELITYFSPSQLKNITEIAKLSFLKNKPNELKLLLEIISHAKSQKQSPLYKVDLIKKIGVEAKDFNRTTSTLFQQVCRSLYLLKILPSPNSNLDLANFFIEQNLNTNANKALEQIESTLNKKKGQSHTFHLYKSRYYELKLSRQKDNRSDNENFSLMNENLDAFYAENKLRLLCEELNRNRITKNTSKISHSDKSTELLLAYLIENEFFTSSSVKTYYYFYKMLLKEDEISYLIAKEELDICLNSNSFSQELEETLISYMMNQCINFINRDINVTLYANEYIKNIKLLESRKYLLTNKSLRITRFNGGIFAGAIAKEVNWMTSFINTYYTKINTSTPDFVRDIHLAYIDKIKGNIPSALKKIEAIKLTRSIDPFFGITYHKIAFEIHYTNNNYEKAQRAIDNFYKYIRTDSHKEKISNIKVEAVLKFISYARKLINLKEYDSKRSKIRADLLNETEYVAYSYWLKSIL